MIGGVIKYFRFSYEFVLWEISYANLSMLLATIPEYDTEVEKKETGKQLVSIADIEELFS